VLRRQHPPARRDELATFGSVAHDRRFVIGKNPRHRRQIANVSVHDAKQRDDGGLVRGNRIEVTHFTEPVGLDGRSCAQTVVALPGLAKAAVIAAMSTKSRQVIFGSRIRGAKICAEGAREEATKAIRAADRAEGEAWSIQMEGYGGPAQPSPTIGQCLNGGYGWLEVECHSCKTRASIPLDAIRRPRNTPIWKLEAALKCRSCKKRAVRAICAHDQADDGTRDHALHLGASGR
jgi:hypothetical protein